MDQSLNQEKEETIGVIAVEPRRALTTAAGWISAHRAELAAGALLMIMSLQMLAVISRKSITIDEIVMIPAAYYHLAASNFQFLYEHPPLSKIVAGFPMLFVQPREPSENQTDLPLGVTEAKYAFQERFWTANTDRFASLSFWPRSGMICLTILLGVLIFRFARELFDNRVAVLSVLLFSLEPTVLGHGRVVQTDIPATFGYLLFFMMLYRYARKSNWRTAAAVGGAAAIAILGKFSMLMVGFVLAPFFIALWWRAIKPDRMAVVKHAATALAAMTLTINAAYFFQHAALVDSDLQWIAASFPSHARAITLAIRALSHIVPKEFLLGILFQFWHNGEGHAAALLGMYSQRGWWYYFPVAFALKSALPFLLLAIASVAWGIYKLVYERQSRFAWVLVPVAVYLVFIMFSHIDIGVRYCLPSYPFLFIAAAALLDRLFKAHRIRIVSVSTAIVLLGWIGIEAVRAYPNQITYMNQLASRAPHWWYLSDSNVEWGDDLAGLASYLRERGETQVLDATLGGFAILRQYGIERIDALNRSAADTDQPRYLAIGASYLNGSAIPTGPTGSGREIDQQRVNFFADYRQRAPEAVIGNSIYVFRVR